MKNLSKILCSCICINLFCILSNAQVFSGTEADLKIKGASLLKINADRKSVDFIKLSPTTRVSAQDHLSWLSREVLHLPSYITLHKIKTETDLNGYVHYRYREFYNHIPVEYGVYYVHIKNGYVESANGEFYPEMQDNAKPSITKDIAFSKALEAVPSSKYNDNNNGGLQGMKSEGELMMLPDENNQCRLAYKFDIYSLEPLKRVYIYIDAVTGKKLKEENRINIIDAQATAVTAYNGTVTMTTDSLSPTNFRLQASKGFGGLRTLNLNTGTNYASATDFTDADNYWNTATIDKYAYDAHYGSEATYDFYFTKFGRNSYDNAGAQINAYVHYSTGFVNAFWDGTQMTYGDGDGIDYTPLTSMEVVGHEITHAVTENSAGLIYSNESGALNESFSDCFGVAIDYYKNPLNANFLMGDQINVNGIPFRNMSDPNQFDNPDTYGGLYWNSPNEVHNNSGVQNYWYYLVCMGGSGTNDLGNAYLVNPIGLNDASAIAYRSLTVYLTPNSSYADARFYSIQAAVDLFGSCSDQVIQVTNAWYAVGVGGLFSNAVVAGFAAPQNYFCVVPATVNFINQSLNATTYSWDFGDGTTSTLAAPSHTYSLAGTYNVTLIANGAAICANADTLLKPNYITVTNGGGPISASCSPATVSYCCGVGITNVSFGSINKTSPDASEGYKDFTCGTATTLTAGDPVPISVTTGISTFENVKAWIDYDNDGVFSNATELAFTSTNKLVAHSGIVNNSINAVLNTPLRMRVIDDNTSVPITGGCSNPQNGQAEDYTITFIANTLPPIADFIANVTTINVGNSVNFSDLTQNAATSWQWSFAGGTPSSSTVQNPTVVYNTLGSYTVSLTVSNSFGTDSITKIAYINVVNSINLCSGVTTTIAPNGQLYDSGGPSGNYQDNENCTLLIDPGCALSITLSFSSFASESGYDYFMVYDGTSTAAPLILTANGSSLPPNVTANSGKMFISWYSDISVVYSGWAATWTSVIGSGLPPVAAFGLSTANPPLSTPVQFTDQTTNTPISWTWDFDDGQTAITQNPTHNYTSPGTYTVTLIAANCITSDTVTQNIVVQGAPVISVNPDSISVSLNCSDSITVPLVIYNTGTGDLVFNIEGTGNGAAGDTSVLVIQDAAAWSFYMAPFLQTNYGITATVINSSQIAATDFSLYNVIITVSAQSTSYYTAISANLAKFEAFVAAGGIVQYQMATFGGTPAVNLAGGAVMNYGTEGQNNGLLLSHPILNGVANPITGSSASHCSMTNLPAGTQVITEADISGQPTTVEYNYGDGVVIASGMTWEFYYGSANTIGLMLPNTTSYVFSKIGSIANWITLSSTADTIAPGDSLIVYVTINSSGLNAGTYDGLLAINSNDPLNPLLNVPVHLVTSGPAILAMSDTCLSFGTITQYTFAHDTVSFSNSGCDTLHITSMISNDPAFTASPVSLDVAPGDTGSVVITFNPQTIGNFSALLSIFNNDIDTVICLNGGSGAAPAISVNPDSIAVTLGCNDSIVIPVTISNTGGSDLIFNVNGSGLLSDTVQVLAYMTGVDTIQEYPGTLSAINQYFTKYKVTKFYSTDPLALQTALQNIDILLFPEHESSALGNYTAISTVVQNFASSGRMVVVCGSASTNGANRIFEMGLFTGNYVNYTTGGLLNVLDTTDVLTDQVPLTFTSPNGTYYDNITNVDKVKLVQYNTYDIVTYRTIGTGKAIYLAFDYYNTVTGSSKIIANAIQSGGSNLPGWLQVSQTTDTLVPGDSTIIYVTINSAGLNAGTYNGQITINSNDPLNPLVNLPVHLVTSGPAILSMSDTCLNFGTITQYTFAHDTVSFSNSGCDTLHITSMISNDPSFTVNPTSLNVAPSETGSVVITFNPQTIGNFNALLSIFNNDIDTAICLNGASGAAPAINVNPDSINVTLSCNDSIVIPVTVTNTGGSDLIFNVNGSGLTPDTVQVLAYMAGVDTIQEYPGTLLAIDQYFTKYKVTKFYSIDPIALQTALQNIDILLFPEHESSALGNYTAIATVVQNFTSSGRTVVVCGSASANGVNRIFDMGLFTGAYVNYTNGGLLNVIDTTDVLTDQVPLSFSAPSATFYNDFTNVDKIKLVHYNNYDVVTYRTIGAGRAIYLAFDYYNTTPGSSKIIANAIQSGGSNLPGWLQVSQTTDTLAPGDSTIIYVTINSAGLNAGTYNGQITINSNDPLNPLVNLPVHLVTSGPAILSMSDTCLNFGTITQYTFAHDTVSFSNSGCDTLHITSMTPNDPAFTVNPASLDIAPGGIGSVAVTFNPQTIGNFSALLSIFNNDIDTVICLNGASGAAPAISIYPDSINVTLGCNDLILIPVTITNTGGSDLTFSVAGNGSAQTGDTSVLVIQDVAAWSLYMASFLQTNYGITPTVITSTQIAATDFSLYNVIITVSAQSTSYYAAISANLAKFETFVASGGIVQYQMATFSGTAPVNLPGGALMNYGSENQNNGLLLSHPILNGVANPITGNSASHCSMTNLPGGTQVITEADLSGQPTAVEYNYGSGVVIASGMTWEYYYGSGNSIGLMLPNSTSYIFSKISSQPSWLSIADTTETLVPGDSVTMYVTIYSGGLSGGTYNANILVSSNDPLHPFDTLPVILNVSFNPCADYVYNMTSSCNGTVNFTDSTLNSPTSWHWDFGDGDTSVLQNPAHQYQLTGTYTVTLIATNAFGGDTISHTVNVTVLPASFTITGILVTATPLQFTATAPGATSWSWNFGDGNTSSLQSPVHSYASVGTYIVTLTVSNGTCFNTSTDTLVILLNGIDDIENAGSLMIVPNPFYDKVTISYTLTAAQEVSLQVIDVTGKLTEELIGNELQVHGRYHYTFEGYAPGVYFVKMKIGTSVSVHKIVKMH